MTLKLIKWLIEESVIGFGVEISDIVHITEAMLFMTSPSRNM